MRSLPRWVLVFSLLMSFVTAAEPETWRAGDKLEISWGGKWYPGEVLEVKDGKYKVRYDGYSTAWDEWTSVDKLRRRGETVPAAVAPSTGSTAASAWKTGDRVEAFSANSWYKGTVIEAGTDQWKVHYDGYGSSADEWRQAGQLRAPGTAVPAKPAPAPVAAVRPASAKAGLEGAFLRVETYYFGSSLSLSNQAWFFTQDGKFSKTPAGGFRFKDFKAQAPTDGTYWIADGKITFVFADGAKTETHDFELKDKVVYWSGLGAIPVEGFPKGWRFDGEYEGGASIGGGAMMSSTTITFSRDGTFRRGSASSFSSASASTVVSGGATSEAAGTYEFDGFTLTMTEAGGAAQTFTVFAYGDRDATGRPQYIYRDETMMRRR